MPLVPANKADERLHGASPPTTRRYSPWNQSYTPQPLRGPRAGQPGGYEAARAASDRGELKIPYVQLWPILGPPTSSDMASGMNRAQWRECGRVEIVADGFTFGQHRVKIIVVSGQASSGSASLSPSIPEMSRAWLRQAIATSPLCTTRPCQLVVDAGLSNGVLNRAAAESFSDVDRVEQKRNACRR